MIHDIDALVITHINPYQSIMRPPHLPQRQLHIRMDMSPRTNKPSHESPRRE